MAVASYCHFEAFPDASKVM